MTAQERRNAILNILCQKRFETIPKLVSTFHVSERTIQRDVLTLSCSYPIHTIRGRYGGVKLDDWYHPTWSSLSFEQETFLLKLRDTLAGYDLRIVNSILFQFALYREL